ncbi:MAG: hypothetical protein ABI378_05030 [Chitinophagaceae bacterium]
MDSWQRKAEQEYILQGMPKGAIAEAAAIANIMGVGIAARPTGVLAHMGIESGNPTKAQEFKNKTSKELDLFLCAELDWDQIGTVIHYNPRYGWTSTNRSNKENSLYFHKRPVTIPGEGEWQIKKNWIKGTRMKELEKTYKQRLSIWPKDDNDPIWAKMRTLFDERAREFDSEDYEYRFGHYKDHAHLHGVYLRLQVLPNMNMVGDHDLFGFTKGDNGIFVHDSDSILTNVQKMLQKANTFQAQHGGIWNWIPNESSHKGIKLKIMGAHSAPDGDPLIYIVPGDRVYAGFYVPSIEGMYSVWEFPEATKWLEQTYSGRMKK